MASHEAGVLTTEALVTSAQEVMVSARDALAHNEPGYFGPLQTSLFGCYHAPRAYPRRHCGVVLCYPMGDEYMRFHRAFRQLADRLTASGFPVLRFDFYGCGDSAGESTEGTLAQWQTDVTAAMQELQRRSGVGTLCLVGMRLGGNLAATVGAAYGNVDSMVLWDPVVCGRAYLQELHRLHRTMLQSAHVRPQPAIGSNVPQEVLGFPLTTTLSEEIEGIDLLALRQAPARQIYVLDSTGETALAALVTRLQGLGSAVQYTSLPDPQLWEWVEDVNKVVVPPRLLQAVVSWIAEVYV